MPITQEIPRYLEALGSYFLLCQRHLIYWLPTWEENSGPFRKNYQLHDTPHIYTSSPYTATSKYHSDQHTMLSYDDYFTWFPIKPWHKQDFPFLYNFVFSEIANCGVCLFFPVVSLLSCLYFRQSFSAASWFALIRLLCISLSLRRLSCLLSVGLSAAWIAHLHLSECTPLFWWSTLFREKTDGGKYFETMHIWKCLDSTHMLHL